MFELHTLCMCENFDMNIDVPAGVDAPPLDTQLHGHYHSNDIPSIRCGGYYILSLLVFLCNYYSRAATIRGWCLGNTVDINDSLIRYVCMYG